MGIKADGGYQGLQKKHAKVLLPKKQSKLKKLTKEEKRGESGVGGQTNQSGECDSPVKDISDIGRAIPKSEKTARTEIQPDFRHLQL